MHRYVLAQRKQQNQSHLAAQYLQVTMDSPVLTIVHQLVLLMSWSLSSSTRKGPQNMLLRCMRHVPHRGKGRCLLSLQL
jgi:hypothetical protein